MLASEWGVGEVFWSMLWFFLFFMWIWLVIVVFGDIFRSRDMGGWGKALWSLFVIFMPYLGVFVYLIARGGKMAERNVQESQEQEAMLRSYVQDVAGNGRSASDEIAGLASLRDKGVLSDDEFQQAKAKILTS